MTINITNNNEIKEGKMEPTFKAPKKETTKYQNKVTKEKHQLRKIKIKIKNIDQSTNKQSNIGTKYHI
jgi:hypothetical protein